MKTNCKICNKEFESKRKTHVLCSQECQQANAFLKVIDKSIDANKDLVENYDYVQCKECGYCAKSLTTHVEKHHKLSKELYQNKHNSPLYAEKLANEMAKINPWANHGGRLSPFSKKFIAYNNLDDAEKEKVIKDLATQSIDTCNSNNNNRLKIDYYLSRGYSQDEAKQALKERQSTFSLEKCISKYGEIDGLIRFNERQVQWQATLNSKSDDEIADINRRKGTPTTGKRISAFNKNFEIVLKDLDISYESEFHIRRTDDNKKHYFYDFKIGNVIIELNGDFWHANPSKYSPSDEVQFRFSKTSVKSILAEDIWQHDKLKCDTAINSGFDYIVIWEYDFINNKDAIIEKVLKYV